MSALEGDEYRCADCVSIVNPETMPSPGQGEGICVDCYPKVGRYGLHEVDEVAYHKDRGSLSVSGAKTLLKAPALFRYRQAHPVFKQAFDFGSAAHALVLDHQPSLDSIYVPPFNDWIKRKGPEGGTQYTTDEREIARQDGMTPVLPKEWAVVCDMADALSGHSRAMELLSEGQAEVSAYAPDEDTGVIRRARLDWLRPDLIVDYKSAVCAEPQAFGRSAASYGYHMQHAWYLDLLRDLGHEARGFLFIVQEKEPPYLVEVIELVPEAVARGRELNALALQRFRDCTESNRWPGYTPDTQITPVDIPPWAYRMTDQEYEE